MSRLGEPVHQTTGRGYLAYRLNETGIVSLVRAADLAEVATPAGEKHYFPALTHADVLYTLSTTCLGSGCIPDGLQLIEFDLKTCQRRQLGESVGVFVSGLTYEAGRLLWQLDDVHGTLESSIGYHDVAANRRGVVPQVEFAQMDPRASGNLVVFECAPRGASELDICVYDFATDQVSKVTDAPGSQILPWISGTFAVWMDRRNDTSGSTFPANADVYGRDLATDGPDVQLVSDPANQYDPRLFGDVLMWTDLRNGVDHGGWWENADVYWRRLGETEEHRLTAHPASPGLRAPGARPGLLGGRPPRPLRRAPPRQALAAVRHPSASSRGSRTPTRLAVALVSLLPCFACDSGDQRTPAPEVEGPPDVRPGPGACNGGVLPFAGETIDCMEYCARWEQWCATGECLRPLCEDPAGVERPEDHWTSACPAECLERSGKEPEQSANILDHCTMAEATCAGIEDCMGVACFPCEDDTVCGGWPCCTGLTGRRYCRKECLAGSP